MFVKIKNIRSIKILSLLLFVGSATVNAQQLSKLYDEVSSSVVFIDVVSYNYANVVYTQKIESQESLGSGVLISKEGLIWTASHVVHGAEEINVEFTDGDIYQAEVVVSNPNADVALIRIKEKFNIKNKHVASIGDSDMTNIGDDVFIIGAPYGFKQSLTKGILSGRYEPKDLSNSFEKVEFLQTDAAINPGNSGGPMFNMNGVVIGIASRIFTISGGFDGIGFAISSNVAKKLLSDENGFWTGMDFIILTPDMARMLNVPQESGLLITHLATKGFIAQVGLRGGYIPVKIEDKEILLGGDIILEILGIPVKDKSSLYNIKEKLKAIGKNIKISVKILRQGEIQIAEFYKK